jgi:hypothetical protein
MLLLSTPVAGFWTTTACWSSPRVVLLWQQFMVTPLSCEGSSGLLWLCVVAARALQQCWKSGAENTVFDMLLTRRAAPFASEHRSFALVVFFLWSVMNSPVNLLKYQI